MLGLAGLRHAVTKGAPPPEDCPAFPPDRRGGAEVSWLGVIADGRLSTPPDGSDQWPLPRGRHLQLRCSAGLAPDFPVASRADANMMPLMSQPKGDAA
jgi:hypothetical protein